MRAWAASALAWSVWRNLVRHLLAGAAELGELIVVAARAGVFPGVAVVDRALVAQVFAGDLVLAALGTKIVALLLGEPLSASRAESRRPRPRSIRQLFGFFHGHAARVVQHLGVAERTVGQVFLPADLAAVHRLLLVETAVRADETVVVQDVVGDARVTEVVAFAHLSAFRTLCLGHLSSSFCRLSFGRILTSVYINIMKSEVNYNLPRFCFCLTPHFLAFGPCYNKYMYYVYLIQSKKTRELYIGVTYDLARRFKEHNEGKSFSTKSARPWILIYYEAYKAVKDAYEREKQIKHYGQSLGHLKRRLKFSLN